MLMKRKIIYFFETQENKNKLFLKMNQRFQNTFINDTNMKLTLKLTNYLFLTVKQRTLTLNILCYKLN